jgi:hypothetical protein
MDLAVRSRIMTDNSAGRGREAMTGNWHLWRRESGRLPFHSALAALALSAMALLVAAPSDAQQGLGNKTLGTLGLRAGSQVESGLYLADRFLLYSADRLVDRNGQRVPVNVDLDVVANGIGIGGAFELPWWSTYLNASIGVPFAHVTLETDRPEASVDKYGLGDVYVQPIKLGWKLSQLDLVAGYAFYAPTGAYDLGGRGGVGRGQWTQEFSLGTTVYFDRARTWHLSALASYELNQRKQDFDITRGATFQIQGGLGKTLFGIVDVGVAGYALWQVTDDRGADLPPLLRGAREQAFGLGPEIGITLVPLRSRLSVRYEHDIYVKARPFGQILVISLTFRATP